MYSNKKAKLLAKFPADVSEDLMFKILDFAREYELIAFNVGIALGKEKTKAVYENKIEQYIKVIEEIRAENERLSEALQREMFNGIEEKI